MFWFGDAMHSGWMIASMSVISLFWLGLLAFIGVAVVRLLGRNGDRRQTAEEILRDRLARGEITSEEYQRLRDELRA